MEEGKAVRTRYCTHPPTHPPTHLQAKSFFLLSSEYDADSLLPPLSGTGGSSIPIQPTHPPTHGGLLAPPEDGGGGGGGGLPNMTSLLGGGGDRGKPTHPLTHPPTKP